MQEQIRNIIKDAALEIKEDFYAPLFNSGTPLKDITLFDEDGGGLTSLDLVSLVFLVEDKLRDQLGLSLILTDDKAMSKENSPFRTVGAFEKYISNIIANQ